MCKPSFFFIVRMSVCQSIVCILPTAVVKREKEGENDVDVDFFVLLSKASAENKRNTFLALS